MALRYLDMIIISIFLEITNVHFVISFCDTISYTERNKLLFEIDKSFRKTESAVIHGKSI